MDSEHDAGADASDRAGRRVFLIGLAERFGGDWRDAEGREVDVAALDPSLEHAVRGFKVKRSTVDFPLPCQARVVGIRPGHSLEKPGDPEWPTRGWLSVLVEGQPSSVGTETRRLRAVEIDDEGRLPDRDPHVVLGLHPRSRLALVETKPRVHRTRDMQHTPLKLGTQVLQLKSVARVNVPKPLREVDGVPYLCWRGWRAESKKQMPEATHYVVVLARASKTGGGPGRKHKSSGRHVKHLAEGASLADRGLVVKLQTPAEESFELWVDKRLLAEDPDV